MRALVICIQVLPMHKTVGLPKARVCFVLFLRKKISSKAELLQEENKTKKLYLKKALVYTHFLLLIRNDGVMNISKTMIRISAVISELFESIFAGSWSFFSSVAIFLP